MRPNMTLETPMRRTFVSPQRVATLIALTMLLTVGAAAQGATPTAKPADAAARAAEPSRLPIVERTEGSGPNGATMRCKDGSYPPNGAPDSACDGKGGILVRFPLRRFPQASTAPKVVAAPPAARAPVDTATANALLREPPMVNRAKEFLPAERPPANATLQCNDGSYVVNDTTSARCATRGGVMSRFAPVRRPPR